MMVSLLLKSIQSSYDFKPRLPNKVKKLLAYCISIPFMDHNDNADTSFMVLDNNGKITQKRWLWGNQYRLGNNHSR
jgi:hypothetical protein